MVSTKLPTAAAPRQPRINRTGRDMRRKVGREARRMFKRVGTCPRSKVRGLPEPMREIWYAQRQPVTGDYVSSGPSDKALARINKRRAFLSQKPILRPAASE